MAQDKKGTNVSGNANVTAGGDLKIINNNLTVPSANFKQVFEAANNMFQSQVDTNGLIRRKNEETRYSSQELFTSLMQIGLPVEAAILIPFQIIPVLEEMADQREPRSVSTADIRVAVVQSIAGLAYNNHSDEEVSMWATAYIRRYGNPGNQFVKVLDNDEEKDLNYEYVKEVIIPHVIQRIVGLDRFQDPTEKFRVIFSSGLVDKMCREIIRVVNTLNLYSIRYLTLIHLIEDLILEPPHPWIVNPKTMAKVIEYNCERALHHLNQISSDPIKQSPVFLDQSAKECIRHLCAIVLSKYGAFLGVGSRYGFFELRRLLKIKKQNPVLWDYCRISELDAALARIGSSTEILLKRLDRIMHHLTNEYSGNNLNDIFQSAAELARVVDMIFPELKLDIDKKFPHIIHLNS